MKDAYIRKFDSVYKSSDIYYGFELRKEFSEFLNKKDISGQSALDLGCGEGRYSLLMAQRGCKTLSIDRSAAGIEKLKRMAEINQLPITAKVIDIENFVFEDNQFDIIVAATVLDHLSGDLRRKTIDGIKNALKPDGTLYVNVFTTSDPGYRLKMNAGSGIDSTKVSDTAECMEYYFKDNELRQVFSDLNIVYYYEGVEPDVTHGRPHDHGWACLLASKP